MTNVDLLLTVCLQLAVILVACRLVGLIGRRLGQSQAVCDMITGILLGPSLFGLLAPTVHQWLFPATAVVSKVGAGGATTFVTIHHPSAAILYVLAQVGIALFMFLVGLEFDVRALRSQMRRAGTVSAAGILAPFILGALAACALLGRSGFLGGLAGLLGPNPPALFGASVSPVVAVLFLGLSLSITAFPVLARILQEHGVAGTPLGTLAIGAAAVDDATAWCVLAVLLALASGSPQVAAVTLGGTALYVLAMATLGRRAFRWLARLAVVRGISQRGERLQGERTDGPLSPALLSVTLGIVLLCCWYTTAIGIHQIFGAFIAGTVMPRSRFAKALRSQLEPITVGLFLPIFFVYSGLNTHVGLLDTPQLWLLTGLITALAIAGKGVACTVAARMSGQSWRVAATVGALMNSRGLVELILLNIGLDLGLITPTLFTMLVIMAIATTALTTPLFRLLYPRLVPRVVGPVASARETQCDGDGNPRQSDEEERVLAAAAGLVRA